MPKQYPLTVYAKLEYNAGRRIVTMPSTALPTPPAPLSATDLADRFGFTLDELALNREGQFSACQRQTVYYRSWGYLARGIVLVVLGTGITLTLTRSAETRRDWTLIGVLVILGAIAVALLILNGIRTLRPTVQIVSGSLRRGEDAWHPSILVGDTVVSITTRRWCHLDTHFPGIYRAYLDPFGRLCSIEPERKD